MPLPVRPVSTVACKLITISGLFPVRARRYSPFGRTHCLCQLLSSPATHYSPSPCQPDHRPPCHVRARLSQSWGFWWPVPAFAQVKGDIGPPNPPGFSTVASADIDQQRPVFQDTSGPFITGQPVASFRGRQGEPAGGKVGPVQVSVLPPVPVPIGIAMVPDGPVSSSARRARSAADSPARAAARASTDSGAGTDSVLLVQQIGRAHV